LAYQTILTTSLSEHFPESVGGVKAISTHGLLSRLIEAELSPQAAMFLAEPMVKDREGRIDWLTQLEGIPVELSMLSGEEREAAEDVLSLRAGELAGLGARLTGAASGERKLAGRLITLLASQAATVTGGPGGAARVMVVGGVPVIAGWGLSAVEAAAARAGHSLSEGRSATALRNPAPHSAAAASALLPGGPPLSGYPPPGPSGPAPYGDGAAFGGSGPPARESPAVPSSGSLNWLKALAAALAVFLLALLAVLLAAPDFRRAAVRAAGEPVALPDASLEPGLRRELGGLQDRYRQTLLACRPPEETPPPPPPGPAIPETELVIPPPPPPPPPEPEPEPAPAAPPGPARPEADSELRIPEDGDLAFLEGCWKSDAGLVSEPGNHPVWYIYCFDGSQGRASVRVDEQRGGRTRACRTTGRARMDGKSLVIQDQGARCNSTRRFSPTKVVCSPGKGGAANCTVQSRNKKKLTTRFTYMGKS
jgi:hypothetical protein